MSVRSEESETEFSTSRSGSSQERSVESSSVYTSESFPDQVIQAETFSPTGSSVGSTSSQQQSQDVSDNLMAEQNQWNNEAEVYHALDDGCFGSDFTFDSIFKEICLTSEGGMCIIPRSMEMQLEKKSRNILQRLEDICENGDVVYIAQALKLTLGITTSKIPASLICDVCIYSPSKPVFVLTIISQKQHMDMAKVYNSQLSKSINTITREEVPQFRVTHGVILQEQLDNEQIFREEVERLKFDSSHAAIPGSLEMGPVKFRRTFEIFLKTICSCYQNKGNGYLTQHMFLLIRELLEERRPVLINAASLDCCVFILTELVARYSLTSRSKISVYCTGNILPEVEKLKRHGENVKVAELDTVAESCSVHRYIRVLVTHVPTGFVSLDFTIIQDGKIKNTETEPINDEIMGARKLIATKILKESNCTKSLTEDENQELLDMMTSSLEQFETRATSFLEDQRNKNLGIKEIKRLNDFMEDYLMQCFRQRSIQLTRPPEISLDSEEQSTGTGEFPQLMTSSKKNKKCLLCQIRDNCSFKKVAEALCKMGAISESVKTDVLTSGETDTEKWPKLFQRVKNEHILKALGIKNKLYYQDLLLQGQTFMECTCDNSESAFVGSGKEKAEDDVANLNDISDIV